MITVHIVTRKGEIVAVHATHDEAYEDLDRRTGRGARPDLDHIYAIESWAVQDERNLTDEQHAEAVAKGLIPATRARWNGVERRVKDDPLIPQWEERRGRGGAT